MKILISTGIYPPHIGGPAKYARSLKEELEKEGHDVKVKTYYLEHHLPIGIRQTLFFFKVIPAIFWADFVFALDTFSVGLPSTFLCKIFNKKIIMRTGGDFLWEKYIERTGDLVLLRDFYSAHKYPFSLKERLIFKFTKWLLHNVSVLVFSTSWQKNIWMEPYDLSNVRVEIVENYYGPKIKTIEPPIKNFMAGTRKLKWKNADTLVKVFEEIKRMPESELEELNNLHLDLSNYSIEEYIERMRECYAAILVSFGDISPNMILEAIRLNKPFILTEENGLMNRIKDIALIVNPRDKEDIKNKVIWLCKKENYRAQVEKIKNFNFHHSWAHIASEIIEIYKKL